MISNGTPQAADLTTRETIDHFNEAFNRHESGALFAMFTVDKVFEGYISRA